MAYSKHTWTNGSGEALNATNLNEMETGIDEAHSDLATHAADTSTHGVTTIAGLSETQTLTNKTIDGDDNTLQDIALTSLKNVDEQSFTNLLQNGDFESWSNGGTAAPDGWTLVGASATIAKENTIIKTGTFSAKLTRAGTDCHIQSDNINAVYYRGRTVTFNCWVNTSILDSVDLAIYDSAGDTNSSKHTGGGGWELLSVSRTINAAATTMHVRVRMGTANGNSYFDGAILVEGSVCPAFSPKPLVDDGIMLQSHTPSAANDYGTTGQICGDANYIYRCISTDSWIRFAKDAW